MQMDTSGYSSQDGSMQGPAESPAGGGRSYVKVVVIVVVVIVALVALAGVRLYDRYINPEVAVVDDTVNVTVAEAVVGDVEVTSVHTGKIVAEDEVNVVPKIPGKVVSVAVELGEKVKKGDVLFEVDPVDVESQQAQARIQRDAAGKGRSSASDAIEDAKKMRKEAVSARKEAKEAVKDAEKAVKDAEKAVKDIDSQIKKAEKAAKDAQNAGPMGMEALAQAQAALGKLEEVKPQAEAGVKQAEAGVKQAEAGVIQAESGVIQADMGVDQAKSAYDQANAQYKLAGEGVSAAGDAVSETKITAPISGYITGLSVQEGGMVAQTMPAVVITGTGNIEVTTTVAETLVDEIGVGDAADIYVRAVSDEPFGGVVRQIVPAPQAGQTTYPVVIDFDNPDAKLKPGMFAEVTMTTGKAEGVCLVPSGAVMIRDGRELVAVLGDGDKVELREVESGIDDGLNIEITSGVSPGERIVTQGQHYIDEDSKVRVAE
jgi:RND family efflux transporter MFP subunit